MFTQSSYAGAINNTLNGTEHISGTLNASNVTVSNDFICNGGIIVTSTSTPANINFICYTATMKLTNSMALSSGYTVLFLFSTPVSGNFHLMHS